MKHEMPSALNLHPNVIDGDELKSLYKTVFNQMSKYVSRTYGPFGENTAYQEGGKILTTKDGWSVEQSIIYSDSTLASLVRKLIIDVSTSINAKAGDGTTTGLIAANEVNDRLMLYKEDNKVHSKFLSSTIQYCVNKICEELVANAVPITDENLEDAIYRIAEVSLDWDKELAGFIRDAYVNTKNPTIRIQNSGTENSWVEIREGYDMSAKLISEFKVNNLGEKKYTVEDPIIIVFSYTVNAALFEPILTLATLYGAKLHKELVVLAPNFEKDFRDAYNALCIRAAKRNEPLPNMVLVRYNAEFNIEREMLIDFSFLTGAVINAKENTEVEEILREYVQVTKQPIPDMSQYEMPKDKQKYDNDVKAFYEMINGSADDLMQKMNEYVGYCDKIVVSDKDLVASGFGDIEKSDALQSRIQTIQAEINKIGKDANAKSMFTDEIRLKKTRLGKLRLKMAIIHVGGFGEGQLKAKRDALDDAINACANAYTDGIIIGGGIAIPAMINKIYDEIESGERKPENDDQDTELVKDILEILFLSFIDTWDTMLKNRYPDGIVDDVNLAELKGIDELTKKCSDYLYSINEFSDKLKSKDAASIPTPDAEISRYISANLVNNQKKIANEGETYTRMLICYCLKEALAPWNLITKKTDSSIIHPVKVETEVIKGVLNLVLTTTTTNQLMFIAYDDSKRELEEMREVK